MHATVRTYRGKPEEMGEMLHILDEHFMPSVTEAEGFCGYQAIDCGDHLVTVSCFESAEQAEATTEMAAQFIRDRLADFDIERVDVRSGAVRVSAAVQPMLEPAHA